LIPPLRPRKPWSCLGTEAPKPPGRDCSGVSPTSRPRIGGDNFLPETCTALYQVFIPFLKFDPPPPLFVLVSVKYCLVPTAGSLPPHFLSDTGTFIAFANLTPIRFAFERLSSLKRQCFPTFPVSPRAEVTPPQTPSPPETHPPGHHTAFLATFDSSRHPFSYNVLFHDLPSFSMGF